MTATRRAAGREDTRSGARSMLLPPMQALLLGGPRRAAGLAAAATTGLHCTQDAIC